MTHSQFKSLGEKEWLISGEISGLEDMILNILVAHLFKIDLSKLICSFDFCKYTELLTNF